MMKYFLLLCFLLSGLVCDAQEFFNKHYQIEQSNLTPANALLNINRISVSYLNFDGNQNLQSGVAELNLASQTLDYKHFQDFRVARDGFYLIDSMYLLLGKVSNISDNIRHILYNPIDDTINYNLDYNSNLDYNFPLDGDKSENEIISGYSDNSDINNHTEFGIIKINFDGELIWQKNFDQHKTRSFLSSLKFLPNGEILAASRIWRDGEFLRLPQILKIDENGIVVDSVIGQKEAFDANSLVPIIVLDENKIVQAYKRKGPLKDYIWMDFYDADLNLLFSKNLTTWAQEDLSTFRLKEGKGDYFFIIGSYTNFDERRQYGSIIKLDHSGNVIWRHRYLHPDFVDDEHAYTVKDLVEEDNGNIYCMGSMKPVNQLQRLWLFKINEQGCLGDQNCEELVITDVEEEGLATPKINIFPNPASRQIVLTGDIGFPAKVRIYNTIGTLLEEDIISSEKQSIDISHLSLGVYIVEIVSNNNKTSTAKFVKD